MMDEVYSPHYGCLLSIFSEDASRTNELDNIGFSICQHAVRAVEIDNIRKFIVNGVFELIKT